MGQTAMNVILPDIPRFYTALAEWLACILCILEMKRRIKGWKLIAISAAALVLQAVFLTMTKGLDDFWWILCMAAAVGLMYLFLFLCCEAHPRDIGYYCVRAFVTAELAASLEWQIECYFYYAVDWRNPVFGIFLLVVIYALVFAGAWLLYRRTETKEGGLNVTSKELTACIIIGLAVFLMSNLGFVSIQTPFTSHQRAEIFNVRTLIDLGGAAILYAYHIQRIDLRTRMELENVQNILHNQYMQYQQSQEAVDMINFKYHDLKHHIMALKAEESDNKRKEYLEKMEEELQTYEAQNKTGNQVLDTLLTSKNLVCMKNHISMTSVVDGSPFGFMDVMDICSIFGNALDNAIECEKKISDPEKRLIHVSAFTQKNFLIIRFENYYEGSLTFREQLPVTTKKEPEFHGYGLKSLRYTVRKYGGEVDVSTQDNWFHLKILIPLEIPL
ncbi:MAG: GHKL domain-containing protein [Faecalicatena sp.]|uniref:GHKL domain-containing protein n=1 Tax=Faecalicatena sp. TaxID=2005360 RepID=UPI00258ED3B4|nr:GHKL domain-containing protein [Faecalicatena sp.]MCI6465514.1 GHKL domain-containing protein [Faecalicatena sp.]MDY5617346.1 GHKL domain-containing protein [Lachnospiraceae bacterium]